MTKSEKIAVLGTGRSGTNFFAAVLAELGRDVQHEKMGADGIASWCLVADVDKAVYGPGGAVLDSSYVVGHQTRNPLKAIGSLTTFNRSSWKYISENSQPLPRNITHRAMKHWLDWNIRAAEMSSFTWQLETLDEAQPEILNRLGWNVSEEEWKQAYVRARHGANTGSARASTSLFNPKVGPITQWRRYKYNNRKHPLTWEDLEKIDTGLAAEIKDFSYALGYNITSSEG